VFPIVSVIVGGGRQTRGNVSPRTVQAWEASRQASAVGRGAEGAIPQSKKSWDGLMRRRLLLEQAGIRLPEELGERAGRVGPDDSSMPLSPRGPPNENVAAWQTT
jgi:hypothetical protein